LAGEDDVGGGTGRPAAEVGAMLARAAADPGLDHEIGAVRVTILRLMGDDAADPLKAALAVARLAAVAVQAARARQSLAEAGAGPLQALIEEAASLADKAGAAGGRGDERSARDAAADGGRGTGGAGAGVDLRGGDAANGGRVAG
jgi:hypothetical protein